MTACKVCGFTNPQGALVCQACGTELVTLPPVPVGLGDAACATHRNVPAVASCDRCGTFYCAACLERRANGKLYCKACPSPLPWDQREQVGMLRAWWQTSMLLLRSPSKTLASAKRDASLGSSLLFAGISTAAGFLTSFLGYAVLLGGVFMFSATQSEKLGGSEAAVGLVTGAFLFVFYGGFIFVGQIVGVIVFSGLEHLMLKLLGAKEVAAYSVTVRAHALGLSPYVLGLIPFCGIAVMGLWSMVLRFLVLAQLQKVSTGKAAIAVFAPMGVLCGGVLLLYAVFIAFIMSVAGTTG